MKSTTPFIVTPKRSEKRTLLPSLRRLSLTVVAAMALAVAGLATDPAAGGPSGNNGNEHWVGSWSTGLQTPSATTTVTFSNQTLRQIVRTSIDGDQVQADVVGIASENRAICALRIDRVSGAPRAKRLEKIAITR